jgi:cytochrome c oxidase assembly factor CtaG
VGASGPYAYDPHAVTWSLLVVGVGAVVVGHRRLVRTSEHPLPWSRRQIWLFSVAVVAAVVVLTWPVADLAAHWSLTALVTQRVILVLAVAPLVLLGLPYDVLQWLTRPAAVDAVLLRLQRPPVAIAAVTVIVIGSMTPALVRAQSSSPLARGLLTLAVLGAGVILWLPVLGRVPGIPKLQPVVRFGYLVAQAVVPAFLSFIFIFSRRPLYPVFARSHEAIGLRPLNDQQIAGFVSKLSMLFVLLIVGAVVLARAPRSDEEFGTDDPLVWADVQRQFERLDRKGNPALETDPATLAGPRVPPDGGPVEDDGHHRSERRGEPGSPEDDRP